RTRRLKMIEKDVRVLPGSFLYPVKLLGEQLRLALTSDGEVRRDRVTTLVIERLYEQLLAPQHTPSEKAVGELLKKIAPDAATPEKNARWCKRVRGLLGEYAATVRVLDVSENPTLVVLPDVLTRLQKEHDQTCIAASEVKPTVEEPILIPAETIEMPETNTNTILVPKSVETKANVNVAPTEDRNTPPLHTNGVPVLFPPQQPIVNQPAVSSNANIPNMNTTDTTNTNSNITTDAANQNTNSAALINNTNQPSETPAPAVTTPPTTTAAPTNTNAAPATNANTNTNTTSLLKVPVSFFNLNSPSQASQVGS
nr:hypothetical protein [Patescibacteria group bacterium]